MGHRLIVTLVVGMLGVAGSTYADPVRVVTSGQAHAHEGDSTFGFSGSGFVFTGEAPGSLGDALGDCVIFLCLPGDVVSLSDHVTPEVSISSFGPATFEGHLR